jgi:hypothetical protein
MLKLVRDQKMLFSSLISKQCEITIMKKDLKENLSLKKQKVNNLLQLSL